MKQKRFISIFVLLTLFFLLLCPLRSEAATNTQQKAVKSQVTKYLNSIKKRNYKAMEKTMTANAKKGIIKPNQQIEKVLSKIQKKWFSYKIKNIKVSGKKATVTVSVKYYDAYFDHIYAFEHMLMQIRKEYLNNPGGNYNINSTKVNKLWAKNLLQAYNNYMSERPIKKYYAIEEDLEPGETSEYEQDYDIWATGFATKTIKISLVKEKGQWKISKYTKAMRDMTDCGIASAHKDILKDIEDYKWYFILGF